jgi:hypothetical protein
MRDVLGPQDTRRHTVLGMMADYYRKACRVLETKGRLRHAATRRHTFRLQ